MQVFNIFYVKEHEKKHVVHCLRCAKQVSKDDFTNWICLGMKIRIFVIRIRSTFVTLQRNMTLII